MPGAFSKIIIYVLMIKHLYGAINKCKTPVRRFPCPKLWWGGSGCMGGLWWWHSCSTLVSGWGGRCWVSKSTTQRAKTWCKRTGRLILGRLEGSGERKSGWTGEVYGSKWGLTFLLVVTVTKKEVCTLRLFDAIFFWGKNLMDSKANHLSTSSNFVPSVQNLLFQISSSALLLLLFAVISLSLKKQNSPSVILPHKNPAQHFLSTVVI